MKQTYVHEIENLEELLRRGRDLRGCVLQGLDLTAVEVRSIDWAGIDLVDAVFLGCRFSDPMLELDLQRRGALVFPRFSKLPYDPYRSSLYSWRELMQGFDPRADSGSGTASPDQSSVDYRIYRHFVDGGRHLPDIQEALAQRIHDHAIENAKRAYLGFEASGLPERRAVGVMGGHGTGRSADAYRIVARTARRLDRRGFHVVTGGGPGIMEAANLGAWLAGEDVAALSWALDHLSSAPSYLDAGYHRLALEVLDRYPRGRESLAVPTWFYGHEPSNLFASAIAKFFSNSLREDGLLAVCMYGVVFAPGSAGTTQEVFMDAVQNHYGTFGWRSPMVFLGRERFAEQTGIFPLLHQLAAEGGYQEMLLLTDSDQEAVEFIEANPPLRLT